MPQKRPQVERIDRLLAELEQVKSYIATKIFEKKRAVTNASPLPGLVSAGLETFVMTNHFIDDETQEFL